MRSKFFKLPQFSYMRGCLLLGLFGLLSILPSSNTFAQNDPDSTILFLPVFSDSTNIDAEDGDDAVVESDLPQSDDHDHLHIGHIPEDGRFSTNTGGELAWPPQVKYIDEVVWDTKVDAAMAYQTDRIDAASDFAFQHSEVRELLGDRYTFISTTPIKEKWDNTVLGQTVTYFSYSNNITIEAILKDGAIESIETFSAAEMQPALRQNEVDAAIEIAREYWQALGNTRVDMLQGFTIQTFQTEGDGGYYDTRMTYVSFHLDETSVPELLTWVDLTSETVFRAAIDDGGVLYEQ